MYPVGCLLASVEICQRGDFPETPRSRTHTQQKRYQQRRSTRDMKGEERCQSVENNETHINHQECTNTDTCRRRVSVCVLILKLGTGFLLATPCDQNNYCHNNLFMFDSSHKRNTEKDLAVHQLLSITCRTPVGIVRFVSFKCCQLNGKSIE